jgi:hypothetical protein
VFQIWYPYLMEQHIYTVWDKILGKQFSPVCDEATKYWRLFHVALRGFFCCVYNALNGMWVTFMLLFLPLTSYLGYHDYDWLFPIQCALSPKTLLWLYLLFERSET